MLGPSPETQRSLPVRRPGTQAGRRRRTAWQGPPMAQTPLFPLPPQEPREGWRWVWPEGRPSSSASVTHRPSASTTRACWGQEWCANPTSNPLSHVSPAGLLCASLRYSAHVGSGQAMSAPPKPFCQAEVQAAVPSGPSPSGPRLTVSPLITPHPTDTHVDSLFPFSEAQVLASPEGAQSLVHPTPHSAQRLWSFGNHVSSQTSVHVVAPNKDILKL